MKRYFLSIFLVTFIFGVAFPKEKKGVATKLVKKDSSISVKNAKQIFGVWIDWQYVFQDMNIEKMKNNLDSDDFWKNFAQEFKYNRHVLKSMSPFLASLTNGELRDLGASPKEQLKENLEKIYVLLEKNIPGFINFLNKNGISSYKDLKQEEKLDIEQVVEKYRGVGELLFVNQDNFITNEYMFAIANRFFDFCFSPKTFPMFRQMLSNQRMYGALHFLYSTMWYYFVGDGWKHWHENCLNSLKQATENGKTVVYIAGGTDIYQLLKHGIYNITVIDPILPSQPDYYSEGWMWLVKGNGGGVGDIAKLNFGDKKLILRRESYRQSGSFMAKLSTGITAKLPRSLTIWAIYDAETKKRIGTVKFDRRFCKQEDFVAKQDEVLLMSFNEMYFVSAPNFLDGWGMRLKQMPENLKLYVKQLRHAVGRQELMCMRISDFSDFSFIMLGSSPN